MQQKTAGAAQQRVRGFDGVRGLAAVAVILHHTWVGKRNLGSIPVEVFFVLSGFLICGILHSARQRIEVHKSTVRTELFHFWVNRGLRIMPLYYAVLILTVVAGIAFGLFQDVTNNLVWYALYAQNFFMAFVMKYFGSIGHMWTLAVEQQFYVAFGLLLLMVPAKRHLAFLLVALLICFAGAMWAFAALPFPGKYILPFDGFFSIICGGIASIAISRQSPQTSNGILGLICCAALAGLAILPENPTFIPDFDVVALIGTSFFAAILFVEITRNQSGIVTKVLDMPLLRWLGAISYGVYIIHGVVRYIALTSFHMYSSFRTFAVVLIVTLALAQASRVLIELPALRMKYRTRRTALIGAVS